MFPPSTSISFRIAKLKSQGKANALIDIRFILTSLTAIPPGTKVCLLDPGRKFPICGEISSETGSKLEMQIPESEIKKPYLKLTANLIAPSPTRIALWGLIVK
jgi:hypothetical protein